MNDRCGDCNGCEIPLGKYTISKLFKFEAAHRLVSSYSKPCQRVHGHSYKLELRLQSQELNEDGMVIDFGRIKDALKECLEQFDHKFILHEDDLLKESLSSMACDLDSFGCVFVPFNPTAENMAKFFYELTEAILYQDEELRCVNIAAVRIYETETGWAEYSR